MLWKSHHYIKRNVKLQMLNFFFFFYSFTLLQFFFLLPHPPLPIIQFNMLLMCFSSLATRWRAELLSQQLQRPGDAAAVCGVQVQSVAWRGSLQHWRRRQRHSGGERGRPENWFDSHLIHSFIEGPPVQQALWFRASNEIVWHQKLWTLVISSSVSMVLTQWVWLPPSLLSSYSRKQLPARRRPQFWVLLP